MVDTGDGFLEQRVQIADENRRQIRLGGWDRSTSSRRRNCRDRITVGHRCGGQQEQERQSWTTSRHPCLVAFARVAVRGSHIYLAVGPNAGCPSSLAAVKGSCVPGGGHVGNAEYPQALIASAITLARPGRQNDSVNGGKMLVIVPNCDPGTQSRAFCARRRRGSSIRRSQTSRGSQPSCDSTERSLATARGSTCRPMSERPVEWTRRIHESVDISWIFLTMPSPDRPWRALFVCKHGLDPRSEISGRLPQKFAHPDTFLYRQREQPRTERHLAWGVYQIGEVYARSCSTMVTSLPIWTLKYFASYAVQRGVGICSTRT